MKGGVYLDAEVPHLVQQHFALVQAAPAVKQKRSRFPENVVEVVASAEEALQRQAPAENLHAAEVMGPSRSSEGLRMYYLVRWLSE
jgi:glycerate-2-kinase